MTSEQLKKGQKVRHPLKNEWGLGLILDTDETKAKILFEDGIERTLMIQMAGLRVLTGADAESHILDNISRKERKAHYSLKKTKVCQPKYSFSELFDKFLALFPKGFYDKDYIEREREYKIDACELFRSALNSTKLHSLCMAKKYSEVCTMAKRVCWNPSMFLKMLRSTCDFQLRQERNTNLY